MNSSPPQISPPGISGISLIKVPVSDLAASLAWYEMVFDGKRLPQFDHVDAAGQLFAYMLAIPGLSCPLQLRLAPETARNVAGFDPIGFAVETRTNLEEWERFLLQNQVENSSVLRGLIGWFLILRDPDGLSIRLFSDEHHEIDPENSVTDSPWLSYPSEEGSATPSRES